MDIVAVLPLYISLTEGMERPDKRRLLINSVGTALGVALLFIFVGTTIFDYLGISEAEFKIGGGLILLTIAIFDLVSARGAEKRRTISTDVGIVPIGIPLIMGPASLMTLLVLKGSHGYVYTLAALIPNLMIVWLSFRYSKAITRVIGVGGAKAMGKVMYLFLSAIAVAMIKNGLSTLIKNF